MASSASSSLLASTSIFSENPPTDLAFFTALVMDPGHRVSEGLGRWVVVVGPMCKIITLAPNVVVLQHDHRRQVHSVSINATHQHRVLLHHPETFKKPRKSQEKKKRNGATKKGLSPGVVILVPATIPCHPLASLSSFILRALFNPS